MMSQIKINGHVQVKAFDSQTNTWTDYGGHNLVVSSGHNLILSRLKDASLGAISHIGIGTGTATPIMADTALSAQTARVALSESIISGSVLTMKATFGEGVGTGLIKETGLFNASSAGTMIARSTSINVDKTPTTTIEITWTLTVAST